MINCLIFGGNGFIGSHLAEGLVDKGYAVKVFDIFPTEMTNLEDIKDKIEIIKGNFLNDDDVIKALKNVDYVFHYISTTVPSTAKKNPIFDLQTNVIGSIKLLQHSLKANIKKFIYSSSGGTVYGEPSKLPICETDDTNPVDPYGISKLTIEKYLFYFNNINGLDYRILRYSNPYGERQNPFGIQGVIPVFLNKIKLGQNPVIYGDGSTIRDYIYIKDAIRATLAVLESQTRERIFNVGSGKGTSLNDVVSIMSGIVGKRIIPEYLENSGNYVNNIVLDTSKLQREVGWNPNITLEEGIRLTWEWIRGI
jgi:UDP-glucose 4-epimerase